MAARQVARQFERPEPRAHQARQGHAGALDKRADLVATGAQGAQAVPAIAALPAARLEQNHLRCRASLRRARSNQLLLLGTELSAYPQTEFALEPMHRALQSRGQCAIGAQQLEAAIDRRHRTDAHEAPAVAAWQTLGHAGRARRLAARRTAAARWQQRLAR